MSIGIVLIVGSIQLITPMRRFIARAELALLAATIRTEQQKARITGIERTVQFVQNNTGYTTQTSTHHLQPGITFGFPPGSYGPPSKEQNLITKPITFKNNQLVCHRTGIVHPGTIYLSDQRNKLFYALTASVSRHTFLRSYYYADHWVPL